MTEKFKLIGLTKKKERTDTRGGDRDRGYGRDRNERDSRGGDRDRSRGDDSRRSGGESSGGPKFTAFVGNLGFKTSERTIREFFRDCGKVTDIRIAQHPDGKSKGFCHVDFDSQESLDHALESKAGKELDGRDIKLDASKGFSGERRSSGFGGGDRRGGRGGRGGGRGGSRGSYGDRDRYGGGDRDRRSRRDDY